MQSEKVMEAIVRLSQIQADQLEDDQEALKVKELAKRWKVGEAVKVGDRR